MARRGYIKGGGIAKHVREAALELGPDATVDDVIAKVGPVERYVNDPTTGSGGYAVLPVGTMYVHAVLNKAGIAYRKKHRFQSQEPGAKGDTKIEQLKSEVKNLVPVDGQVSPASQASRASAQRWLLAGLRAKRARLAAKLATLDEAIRVLDGESAASVQPRAEQVPHLAPMSPEPEESPATPITPGPATPGQSPQAPPPAKTSNGDYDPAKFVRNQALPGSVRHREQHVESVVQRDGVLGADTAPDKPGIYFAECRAQGLFWLLRYVAASYDERVLFYKTCNRGRWRVCPVGADGFRNWQEFGGSDAGVALHVLRSIRERESQPVLTPSCKPLAARPWVEAAQSEAIRPRTAALRVPEPLQVRPALYYDRPPQNEVELRARQQLERSLAGQPATGQDREPHIDRRARVSEEANGEAAGQKLLSAAATLGMRVNRYLDNRPAATTAEMAEDLGCDHDALRELLDSLPGVQLDPDGRWRRSNEGVRRGLVDGRQEERTLAGASVGSFDDAADKEESDDESE